MAKEKRINRARFDRILKEKTALAESIQAHQKEKQKVMDNFEKEIRRYRRGRITRTELIATIPKVRKEIRRLDKEIKRNINGVRVVSNRAVRFANTQSPTAFVVTSQGVRRSTSRKKRRRATTKKTMEATTTRKATRRRRRTTTARRSRRATRRTTARKTTKR